jgi:hypothetical protein
MRSMRSEVEKIYSKKRFFPRDFPFNETIFSFHRDISPGRFPYLREIFPFSVTIFPFKRTNFPFKERFLLGDVAFWKGNPREISFSNGQLFPSLGNFPFLNDKRKGNGFSKPINVKNFTLQRSGISLDILLSLWRKKIA